LHRTEAPSRMIIARPPPFAVKPLPSAHRCVAAGYSEGSPHEPQPWPLRFSA
jgi:hypothetical protein